MPGLAAGGGNPTPLPISLTGVAVMAGRNPAGGIRVTALLLLAATVLLGVAMPLLLLVARPGEFPQWLLVHGRGALQPHARRLACWTWKTSRRICGAQGQGIGGKLARREASRAAGVANPCLLPALGQADRAQPNP